MSFKSFAFVTGIAAFAGAAFAQVPVGYSTGFEAPIFSTSPSSNINGQGGWTQANPSFVGEISTAAAFTGGQSFRRSNNFASGSFSDQTFSPGVGVGVGEPGAIGLTTGYNSITASMWFRSASNTPDGSIIGWALTDALGSRSWSINFRNTSDESGVAVRAFGASNAGPLGSGTTFTPAPDVVLARGVWHRIEVTTTFLPGPGNDLVSIAVNGGTPFAITTWENYYRFDPEQAGNGNSLFAVDRFIFRTSGGNVTAAEGFYFDELTYVAVPTPGTAAVLALGGLLAARRRRA